MTSVSRFCPSCGNPNEEPCRICGQANELGHRFCKRCGSSTPYFARGTADSRPTSRPAERRQLTIMFVDLVGSTALSARLDPEDLCQVIGDYQVAVGRVVAEAGGFIARYVGDGILIYFGYPYAREDDPERAVRCGLRVAARIRALETQSAELAVRIGIATGEVVVGDVVGSGASKQVIALGDAPNIGSRLQAAAEPSSVLIDERTWELTGGLFDYEDRVQLLLKGLSRPVSAFSVKSERAGISRFAALRPSRAGLIGREEELGLLVTRWRSAQEGNGRAVLISGEPGIGKSRLVATFVEQFAAKAPSLHLACVPNGADSPLLPVRQAIERTVRLQVSDAGSTVQCRLNDLLAGLSLRSDYAAVIGGLLHGTGPEENDLLKLTPRQLKERTLDAIDAYVFALSRGEPAVIVVEDLHWVDPTTAEWLARRLVQAETSRVLMLVTTRREDLPHWSTHPLVTNLVLNRLHHRQTAELIQQIVQSSSIPSEAVTEIIRRSDGLPLFIEELTQTMLDGGDSISRLPSSQVRGPISVLPTSLESLLASRLDRAGEARDVAQIASAIGREFTFALLEAVAVQETGPLMRSLVELVDHGLITRQGDGEDKSFAFRHVLIQEAAYRTLIGPRRRELHLRIATVLDQREVSGTAIVPEQVALHYGWAGQHERALELYRQAALQARGRYALVERAQQLRQAVVHARSVQEAAMRPWRELEVLIELGLALIDHRGSGHDDVRETFERARELCLKLRDYQRLVTVLDALALNHHFARSESIKLLHFAVELDEVSASEGMPLAALWAARMRSSARLLRGELSLARTGYEAVMERYRELDRETAGANTARDPWVSTYGNLAICMTAQGRVSEGLAALESGMLHAKQSKSVPSVMSNLRRACLQGMMVRDGARVRVLARQLIALNSEYETFTGLREGTIAQGWALIRSDGDAEALRAMIASLDELEAAQHFVFLPFLMGVVAEQAWLTANHVIAHALLQRASRLLRRTGELWCEAELIRLEALFCGDDQTGVVLLLERSLSVARAQGAGWWELRAATDLCEIWAKTGLEADAVALLRPMLPWFAELPVLPDTVRARALMARLTR